MAGKWSRSGLRWRDWMLRRRMSWRWGEATGGAGLDGAKTYELEVEGSYRGRGDDKDDGERERKFRFETKLQIPLQGPGSATATTNHGPTHQTQGPYPGLRQPPHREKNENRAPHPDSP